MKGVLDKENPSKIQNSPVVYKLLAKNEDP